MTDSISYAEAGKILALAAARDQRITGDADILAWHSDLNAAGIAYDDANAALTRFYAVDMAGLEPEHRRRVTTPDIIGIARKIRSARLENFVYDGDPDESPAQYLARLRGQLTAVASGKRPAGPAVAAITGPPPAELVSMLAMIGRDVPDEDEDDELSSVRRPGPLGVDCPDCHAPIGRNCRRGVSGKERKRAHSSRREAAFGKPPEDRTAEQQEVARRKEASRLALVELGDGAKPEPDDGFRFTPKGGQAS